MVLTVFTIQKKPKQTYGCRSKAVASGEMMGGDECRKIPVSKSKYVIKD